MVLTAQKPLQRERFGKLFEGLPGSTLERGMCGEKHQGLGRPQEFLGRYMGYVPYRSQVGRPKQQVGEPKTSGESDQSIVLGDGSAGHKGKGLTGSRSPQRKHEPDMQGRGMVLTSLRGIAVVGAEARLSEEPGAGKLHAGICAGGRGATPFPTATAAEKENEP